MKKLFVMIAVILLSVNCFAQDEETASTDWQLFKHFSIGSAWEANGTSHSIAFVSILSYKELVNLDLGLIDFEQVEQEGSRWYDDADIGLGFSTDVLILLERFPVLGDYVTLIPDIVGIGVGVYVSLDGDMDVLPMLYVTATW